MSRSNVTTRRAFLKGSPAALATLAAAPVLQRAGAASGYAPTFEQVQALRKATRLGQPAALLLLDTKSNQALDKGYAELAAAIRALDPLIWEFHERARALRPLISSHADPDVNHFLGVAFGSALVTALRVGLGIPDEDS
jgi:hypothetical protein